MTLLSTLLSEEGAFSIGLNLGGYTPGVVGSLLVIECHLKMKATQIRTGPREIGTNVQCLDQTIPGNSSGHSFS